MGYAGGQWSAAATGGEPAEQDRGAHQVATEHDHGVVEFGRGHAYRPAHGGKEQLRDHDEEPTGQNMAVVIVNAYRRHRWSFGYCGVSEGGASAIANIMTLRCPGAPKCLNFARHLGLMRRSGRVTVCNLHNGSSPMGDQTEICWGGNSMFEKTQKRILAIAPIGLAIGLAVGSIGTAGAAAHGGMKINGPYVLDSAGKVVTDGSGKCVKSPGGFSIAIPECGDAMKPKGPMDSDGDGVTDDKDECPDTIKGVAVNAVGCPKDSDNDGVPDSMDKCPGTRAGARVNVDGCEIIENVTIQTTVDHFDFDSAELKPAMMAELDAIAEKIKSTDGDEKITVIGHTDSTGPEAYNQRLSERRAQAVADYLASKGITNLSIKGMGESQPIADNSTREGRAKNRRVEIIAE
ncbi:MAG: hypothetical protein D6720_12240 [Gammaproteobacteria bacterium]|nr:MAG: hypothetical protein D6720_12240 [Gammaproteobacteria bacterium]